MLFSKRYLAFLWALLFLYACGGKNTAVVENNLNLDYDDASVQQIISLRGKYNANGQANTEALRTYLASDKTQLRLAAALVLASVQDSSLIPNLQKALKDEYPDVRAAAAVALGLTKSTEAAKILSESFKSEPNTQVRAAILEAIGRCGTEEHLKHLATAAPYPLKDSLLLQAQAFAIYRLAVRGIVHSEATNKIINEFIANSQMNPPARLISANYLARAASIEVSSFETALTNAVTTEKDSNVLMFLVLGLGKTKSPSALITLKNLYNNSNNGQVKMNIIRSFRYFPYDSSRTVVFTALGDSVHPHLPFVAAEHLYNMGKDLDAAIYQNYAAVAKDWRTRYQLYAAALKNLAIYKGPQRNFLSQKLLADYPKASSEYEKAAIVRALGEHIWNYKSISRLMFPVADSLRPSPIVLSACAEALVAIRSNPDFDRITGMNRPAVLNELNPIFRRCIESGDVGVQALVAEMFCNPKLDFSGFADFLFLKEAQKKLQLPRDLETHIFIQKALNSLEKKADTKIDYHQYLKLVEADWQVINGLKTKPQATIRTNKGDIVLKLLYQEAPATVSHFVQLAQSKFYDNKSFHRVVPNFVVQGGCPRGDGYGGFDYGSPTEISSARFGKAGMVGMASAGKDTESSQFFITHAPAIHLDGNYTVFAEVEKGLDVVQKLAIGDTIKTVQIGN